MRTYKRVYFRIDTPSYYRTNQYGVGFENNQDKESFHNKTVEVFLNNGWQLKEEKYNTSGSCNTVTKDKQELYLHPQEFSGVVLEENIPYIEQFLSNDNSVFTFKRTDIYEDVFDITDDEYMNILESKRKEIEIDILEGYKTKRSNLYIAGVIPLSRVLDKYRIKRLSHYIGVY